MEYKLGQIVKVDGQKGVICYINNGFTWVKPIKDKTIYSSSHNDRPLYTEGLAFAKLDANGRNILNY